MGGIVYVSAYVLEKLYRQGGRKIQDVGFKNLWMSFAYMFMCKYNTRLASK